MLFIDDQLNIPLDEIQISPIRAQGAGGQNVNKVASAIHLRFDLHASSLPAILVQRLLNSGDQRINKEGVLVIKAQQYRTQEQNREDALRRLQAIVRAAVRVPKPRKATRPSLGARRKRMDEKRKRGQLKSGRKQVID